MQNYSHCLILEIDAVVGSVLGTSNTLPSKLKLFRIKIRIEKVVVYCNLQ